MTLAEVCEELGYSPTTLMTQFTRTQKSLEKKGIIITKWGTGLDAEYEIEREEREDLQAFKK